MCSTKLKFKRTVVKISTGLFAVNILFCAICIPPEGSAYTDNDIFDSLESDLIELNSENN